MNDEFKACLAAISQAIREPEPNGLQTADYIDLLDRSTGLRRAISELSEGPVNRELLISWRARIHTVFGAPGDWGHERPLGAALQKLYLIKV